MNYMGFSTAICAKCQGVEVPDQVPQEVQDASVLYPEEPAKVKAGLRRTVFRALGFGRVKEKKAPAKRSRELSKEKKRTPIFDTKDETDDDEVSNR